MRDQIVSYFSGEKSGAAVLVLIGLCALSAGAALVLRGGGYRGAALPILLVALVELGVGIGVYARTDRQVAGILAGTEQAPQDTARAELSRMSAVMRTFEIIKIVELVIIGAGVVLVYALRRNDFAFAAGIGCIAQGATMLLFDLIAERRAEPYVAALRTLTG